MGWTSENVAKEFHVTREEQDAYAAESFQKAEVAQKNLHFVEEIVPFTVLRKEQGSDKRIPVVVREDDGIRFGTTVESLLKIKPAFPQWGNSTTTGGNASQITDGAAAILLMTRKEAEKRGLQILGKFITTAVAGKPYVLFRIIVPCHPFLLLGVQPRIMGIGPVYAIPLALKNAGLELKDIDLFEVLNFMIISMSRLILPFCRLMKLLRRSAFTA